MSLQTSIPISHDYIEVCKLYLEKVLKNLKKMINYLQGINIKAIQENTSKYDLSNSMEKNSSWGFHFCKLSQQLYQNENSTMIFFFGICQIFSEHT